jgi:hypothetical protein
MDTLVYIFVKCGSFVAVIHSKCFANASIVGIIPSK